MITNYCKTLTELPLVSSSLASKPIHPLLNQQIPFPHLEVPVSKKNLYLFQTMHCISCWCRIQMYFGIVWTVWASKKCTQKVFVTLFSYLFYPKTKWNIVYENLKTKIFSRDTNIIPQKHWTLDFSGLSATTIGDFWVSQNYPIINFKKTVCPKTVWMRHCFFKETKM